MVTLQIAQRNENRREEVPALNFWLHRLTGTDPSMLEKIYCNHQCTNLLNTYALPAIWGLRFLACDVTAVTLAHADTASSFTIIVKDHTEYIYITYTYNDFKQALKMCLCSSLNCTCRRCPSRHGFMLRRCLHHGR